jgi:hypothetical protein
MNEKKKKQQKKRLFKVDQPLRRPCRAAREVQPMRRAEKQKKKKLREALDARQPFMNRACILARGIVRTYSVPRDRNRCPTIGDGMSKAARGLRFIGG